MIKQLILVCVICLSALILEVVSAPSESESTETENKFLSKGILKNPQLLEVDKRDGTPLGWDTILLRKEDGTWLKSADVMKIITVSKDEVILFRGQPTARIEFVEGKYNMWIFGQKLLASELRGKTLRVKFHALRTAGAEQRSGYDIILRLRAWEKGTLVQTADATASCLKNTWTEASFELKVNPGVDQMDIQAFGPKQNTLNVSGFLVEVEQDSKHQYQNE